MKDFEQLETRIGFMQQIVPHDDIYEFADLLLQMSFCLSNVLYDYTNFEHVFKNHPVVEKVIKNLVIYRLKMKNDDTNILDIEKMDLLK